MFDSVQKARNLWNDRAAQSTDRQQSSIVPSVFRPPPGGYGYYSRTYRWQQVLAYKTWTFVAITAWMREIAGGEAPQLGKLKKKQDAKKRAIRKALGGPKAHQEFEPYDDDHPLVRVFSNPNGPDVAYDLWAYHTLFKKLTGVSLWWVMRNALGVPVEIWVIPSHWAQLVVGDDSMPKWWWVQSPWGHEKFIPYEEVVAFYEHSPLSRYEGFAVTQAIAEWLDSYDSMTRMRLAVWKNGAVPAIHIKLGEAYADPDEQFLARFYSKWFSRFGGENNSGRPLITGSDVEVSGVEGHRPADALAASNDTEEHIRDQTLASFSVPKAIVGLTDGMTWGSVEASQDAFRTYAVNAEMTYTGQVLTEKVVKSTPHCEDGICFWNDRRTGDPQFKMQKQNQDLSTGVRSVNECRAEDGLEPWEFGGDNPTSGGQPTNWFDGKSEQEPLEAAFHRERERAMGGTSGASGGYTIPAAFNGRELIHATNGVEEHDEGDLSSYERYQRGRERSLRNGRK